MQTETTKTAAEVVAEEVAEDFAGILADAGQAMTRARILDQFAPMIAAARAEGRREGREAEKEARRCYGYSSYATAQIILAIEQGATFEDWKARAREIIAEPDAERVESVGAQSAALLTLEDTLKDELRDATEDPKENAGTLVAVMIEAGYCEINFQEVAAHILEAVATEDEAEANAPRVEVAYQSPTFGAFVIRWFGGHTIHVQDEAGEDVTVWTTYGEGSDEPTEDDIRASIERQTAPEEEAGAGYIEELIRGEIAAR